ncbi:MAG: SEC-C domain-containing protein [Geodermatophilaceae bacterium]|nr:SEC-C domain-containing protein [Geodermatophilaceae bacterium]MDQ3464475.1 SEC-C domain-containing protein [Actinomycetota bacterium]
MSRRKPTRHGSPAAEGINPRQPCPCGSGKRYKSCHGNGGSALVTRPFAGLASECDWIALRELVPAGTAPLHMTGEHADRDVTLATVLPMALPALTRADGRILVALQVGNSSDDASRDVAAALLRALAAEPGTTLPPESRPGDGPRLQDLLADEPLEVTVHDDFAFWLDGADAGSADVAAALEQANAGVMPTVRLPGLDAAYWCQLGDKAHLRWVLPHEEDVLLDALARLSAAGTLDLGEGTRYAGSFRAHGVLAPVWDLPHDAPASDWEAPAAAFAERLAAVLAADGELTDAERRARAGLRGRQLTLR